MNLPENDREKINNFVASASAVNSMLLQQLNQALSEMPKEKREEFNEEMKKQNVPENLAKVRSVLDELKNFK